MAQLAFGAGGAVLGSFVGQPGLGFTAGTLLYSLTQGGAEDTVTEGPHISRQISTTSAFGIMRPIVYGTFPVPCNVIDSSPKREIKHEQSQDAGGKGFLSGPTSTVIYYTAQIDIAIGLGEGPRDGLVRLYAGQVTIIEMVGGAVKTSIPGLKYKIYPGDDQQMPDPTLQRVHGAGNTPAYRGEAYVVLTDFDLEPFGNNVPPFRAISTSKATSSNSTITKSFGGSGQVAGLWQDRRRSLAYHQGNAPSLGKMIDVYDATTRQLLYTMPFVDADMRGVDEGGGSGLFSIPVVAGGEVIGVGPNMHFFVCVELAGPGTAGLGLYDAPTGSYIKTLDLAIAGEVNTQNIAVNESGSITFRVNTAQAPPFDVTLRSWELLNVGGIEGISITPLLDVRIPFSRAAGESQWKWDIYREGTNRQGRLAALGTDQADSDKLWIVFIKERNEYPEAYAEAGTDFASVTSIIHDSVQDLYWVIGQSSTSSSNTRLKAFNFDSGVVHNTEIVGDQLYLSVRTATFAPERNGIMWVASGDVKLFNTSDLSVVSLGAGAGGGGPLDQAFYNNDTNSYWCLNQGFDIDITSLGRINPDALTLDVPVADICNRAGLSTAQYRVTDLASVPFYGMGILNDQQFRSVLRVLQEGYIFDGVDKGDLIDFLLRGKDPVLTIPKEHLGCFNSTKGGSRGDDPIVDIDDRMDLELPGYTEVTYYSEALEYEQQTAVAHRWASNLEDNKATMTLPLVLDDDYAAKLTDIKEHLSHISRVLYRVKALPMYRFLCPGDVIGVTDEDDKVYVGQIIRKSFNRGVVELNLVRDDKSLFQSFRTAQVPQPRTTGIANNPLTFTKLVDGPLFFTSHNNMGFPIANAGFSTGWKGANVYRSFDVGASFNLLGSFFVEAVMGNTLQAIPARGSFTPDTISSFSVKLKNGGTIPSAPIDDVLKGANHAIVGDNGRWEVIGIVNSTLQTDGSFLIEPPILRGRLGTEHNTGKHVVNDIFILLDAGKMEYIPDSLENINRDLTFRSASIGVNLFTGQAVDQVFRNTGECMRPYPPALFRSTRDEGTLDIYFSWDYRTRFQYNDFWTSTESDPPLFKLVITDKSTQAVLRTVEDFTDSFYNYVRADQITDGLPSDGNVVLAVTVQHKTNALPAGSNLSVEAALEELSGPPIPPIIPYAVNIGMFAMWELADDLTNPAPDFSTVVDYFGNYDAECRFANNLLVFGEPGLLPGPYKKSCKFDEFGRIGVAPIPYENTWNLRNFAISCVFEALEVKSGGDSHLVEMTDDKVQIIWAASGELQVYKSGPFTATLIQTGIFPTVGQKYIITATYWNDTSAAPGQPLNVFVNGQKFTAINRATSSDQDNDIGLQMGYTPQIKAAYRLQMVMAFGRKLTDLEAFNLQKLSGLF